MRTGNIKLYDFLIFSKFQVCPQPPEEIAIFKYFQGPQPRPHDNSLSDIVKLPNVLGTDDLASQVHNISYRHILNYIARPQGMIQSCRVARVSIIVD